MDQKHTHLNIEAPVSTRDHQPAGRLVWVIIDPATKAVLDIVVRRRKGRLGQRDIVVPIANVWQSSVDHVWLDLDGAELDRLPDYRDTDYIPVPSGWFVPAPYPPGGLLWPAGFAATAFSQAEVYNIPPGSIAVAEGTEVYCPDGLIGLVDEVITDPNTRRVLGFMVRRGRLLTHDVFVPVDWLAEVTASQVTLNRTKAEIGRLDEHTAER